MKPIELTWSRALKVWWSYSWRAFVLTMLVMIPCDIVLFGFVWKTVMPEPGSPADPAHMAKVAGVMMLVWPVVMAATIAVQVQAMRWMLKGANWSDFRIDVVSRDSPL